MSGRWGFGEWERSSVSQSDRLSGERNQRSSVGEGRQVLVTAAYDICGIPACIAFC